MPSTPQSPCNATAAPALGVLLLLVAVADAGSQEQATSPTEHEGYKLVWSDEFDKDGRPDANKWKYERGFVRNEELQWYHEDNAKCEDGLLVIEARRQRVPNDRYDATGRGWQQSREYAEYTSASLLTRGLASWRYGRFEMRARIDVSSGMWPAFWTLGEENRWPACGEIDIMEYYRGTILANAAWSGGRFRVKWDDSKTPLAELGDEDWAKQFHLWRMDWDEERIELSVDGRVLNEVDLSQTFNAVRGRRRNRDNDVARDRPDRRGENPFRQPHYMLINLAIGGTNGGDASETEFPRRYEVDYVRVYQEK